MSHVQSSKWMWWGSFWNFSGRFRLNLVGRIPFRIGVVDSGRELVEIFFFEAFGLVSEEIFPKMFILSHSG